MENTLAVFRGFRLNSDSIDLQVLIDGEKRYFRYFKPTKDNQWKTVEQQEVAMFNKLAHFLEVFGVQKDSLSTTGNLKDLHANLVKFGKPFIGNQFYLKLVKQKDYINVSSWFPFCSLSPDLTYHENELKYAIENKKTEEELVDDLPF